MFANHCASARTSNRDCMSPGSGAMNVDVDLKTQLIYMQMTIKDIGANMSGLERKIDGATHGLNSVEQALLQLQQHQISSRGSDHAELNALLEQNMLMTQKSLVMQGDTNALAKRDSGGASHSSMHQESLQKIEQGVNDLLAKGINTGGPFPGLTEGKAGAPFNLQSEIREELRLLQMSLTNQINMVQESLNSHRQDSAILGSALLQPPSHQQQQAINPQNVQAQSDVALVEAEASYEVGRQGPVGTNGAATSPQAPKRRRRPSSKGRGISQQKHEQAQQDYICVEGTDEEDHGDHHMVKIELKENGSMDAVFSCDADFSSPPYNVEDFYYKTGFNQRIARGKFFENFTVGVVVFNAFYIGFDSDYNRQGNIYDAAIPFQVCSQFFCAYFTWELVVRFLAFERKRDCLKDGWFKFDAFLVATMILDTWLLMPVLKVIGGGVKIPTQPLRMLRLFKLTRMARLMQAFPELVTMIKGLVRSLRAISSSMILIGLMVYVWAIMMHMLLKEEDDFNQKLWSENLLGFATITQCIWTLLMDGTLMLDNSAPLMTSLLFSDKFNFILAGAFFMTYALLSAMLILQMLIGVLCDVVSRVGSEQRDAIAVGLVKQELLQEMNVFDEGNGKITQAQLLQVMNNANTRVVLKNLNINRLFLLQLQKVMFVRPGMQVTIKSVLELMVLCRGDNPATVESLSGGLLSVIREIADLKQWLHLEMHNLLEHLDDDIAALDEDLVSGEEDDAAA